MLYLSQVLNSKVTDSSDAVIGRLQDVLVRLALRDYASMEFISVRKKNKEEVLIPFSYVENLSHESITLKGLFNNIPTATEVGSFVFLQRDILDQQIVDIGGARVVRVNDLKVGLVEDRMCVLGIDVSFKGLLRRLGLEKFDFFSLFPVHLIDWRQTQPTKGSLKLDTMAKNLNTMLPADLANVIEDLNFNQSARLMDLLDSHSAAKVIEEMEPHLQKVLIKNLGPEKAGKIIEKMSANEIVDLLKMLKKEDAQALFSQMQNGKLNKVKNLIEYGEDTAGGLMTTDYFSALPSWTVRETIGAIKKSFNSLRSLLYIYVVNEEGDLMGSISLRRLIVAEPQQTLKEIIKELPHMSTLRVDFEIKDVLRIMTKYDLYTGAVLDGKKLVGIVTVDEMMRYLVPNA
jgi:hypothetical protein